MSRTSENKTKHNVTFLPKEASKSLTISKKQESQRVISMIDQIASSAISSSTNSNDTTNTTTNPIDDNKRNNNASSKNNNNNNINQLNLPTDPLRKQLYEFFYNTEYENQNCADCRCDLKIPTTDNNNNTTQSSNIHPVYCSFSSIKDQKPRRNVRASMIRTGFHRSDINIIFSAGDYYSSDEDHNTSTHTSTKSPRVPGSVSVPTKASPSTVRTQHQNSPLVNRTPLDSRPSLGGKTPDSITLDNNKNAANSVISAATMTTNDTSKGSKLLQTMRIIKFKEAHSVFAPPWVNSVSKRNVYEDSNHHKKSTNKQKNVLPTHGVFICASCSLAHNSLGADTSIVKGLSSNTWRKSEVDIILNSGGNKYATILYEKYLPPHWRKKRIPNNESTLADRELFIISKYSSLAFVFPNNLLNDYSWSSLLERRVLSPSSSSKEYPKRKLVDRLVDFFCICGPTKNVIKDDKVSHVRLETAILSQYPQDADSDLNIPAELHRYVFPNGCRPSAQKKVPMFFTFMLTNEYGAKMYGASLQVYDESMDMDQILGMVRGAGFEGALAPVKRSSNMGAPQVLYLPKSLVILSHYPMYDVWRQYLLTLYRLSRYKSPIPLERYIVNFVNEVPLPPQGKCEIQYSIMPQTKQEDSSSILISRPQKNQLPLVGFSYRPLFTCLSVSNVLVVFGCLLQEIRIVFCSKYVSLLAPVSEAFVSLLFPFSWQGVHVPVLPYNLLDILDAPVPFMVGIHSKYLDEVEASERPTGVVFVDLDKDVVHLGFEESSNSLTSYSKCIPVFPDKLISKLKSKIEECGNIVYVAPPNNIKGHVTTGTEDPYENKLRETYAYEQEVEDTQALRRSVAVTNASTTITNQRRLFKLARADRAYANDEYLQPVDLFSAMNEGTTVRKSSMTAVNHKPDKENNGSKDSVTKATTPTKIAKKVIAHNLLDKAGDEIIGFKAQEIRDAFLRFFASIMKKYTRYIQKDENGNDKFYEQEFINSIEDTYAKTFMTAFTKTQMFSAFSQERVMDPERYEWLFFDESIIAKKNKTKMRYKRDKKTPFLDDDSDNVTEVYSPPQPSTLGLPSYQVYYQYSLFPISLNPDLFGKARERRSFHQDHGSNIARPDHHPELLRQDMMLQSLMFPYSFEEIPDRNLEWAVFVMAYRCIGLNHGNPDRKIRITKLSITMLPQATRFITDARSLQSHLLSCIAKLQSRYRSIAAKRYLAVCKVVARKLQGAFRRNLYRNKYGKRQKMGISGLFIRAEIIQKQWRGHRERKRYKYLRSQIILIQSVVRMYIAVQKKQRMLRLCSMVHSYHRMSKCIYIYGHIRKLIIVVQASLRGFLYRKRMAKMRKERLILYRVQLFQLWRRCHTPILYRSKYWLFINRSSFLYIGMHHAELRRLWNILHIKSSKSFHKNFKKVQHKLNSVKTSDVTATIQPVFPVELDPAHQSNLDKAKADLIQERSILLEKLKYEVSDEKQHKIFKSFHVDVTEKQKKLRVTQYVCKSNNIIMYSFLIYTFYKSLTLLDIMPTELKYQHSTGEIRKFAKQSAEFVLSMREVTQPLIRRGFNPCPTNNERMPDQQEDADNEAMSEFIKSKYDHLLRNTVASNVQACMTAARSLGHHEYANPVRIYDTRKSFAYNFDPNHFASISKWHRRTELAAKFLAGEL